MVLLLKKLLNMSINNQSAADITAYCVAGPADSVGVQHLPVRCDTTLTGS